MGRCVHYVQQTLLRFGGNLDNLKVRDGFRYSIFFMTKTNVPL